MRLSLGIGLSNRSGQPLVITATVSPTMGALTDADTPADGYTAGTYASTEGTISSDVPTYYVNGNVEAGAYDLQGWDQVYARVLVTDSVGNQRTFLTNTVTVPGIIVALGAESASEVGIPSVVDVVVPIGAESASEVGSPVVTVAGDTTAPTMTNVNYDEGTSTFTATLSEPATLHFLVDTTEPTSANDIILGTGIFKTTFAVGAGGISVPLEFSSVQAGTHWLGTIPVDPSGNSDFSQAHLERFVFPGPYVATGAESASEVGAPAVASAIIAIGAESASEVGAPNAVGVIIAVGAESASEVGTPSIVSGAWAYSGSVVTNLPASEGWGYTGSVIDTIPAAA